MSNAIARLARLSPDERALVLAHLRSSRLPGGELVTSDEPSLVARGRDSEPPLASFAQEQLWYLTQLAPDVATYNVPFALRFEGPLDVDALGAALSEIARRHEILRTTLQLQSGRLVQVIAPARELALPLVDLGDAADADAEVQRRAVALARTPFQLSEAPLHRLSLLRLDRSGRSHVLIWVLSHALVDGWSIGVLLRELAALYRPADRGATSQQPTPRLQFADYAAWQRACLAGERIDKSIAFWRQRLASCPSLALATDYLRPAVQTFQGATHIFSFPAAMTARVSELGRKIGATPFMVMAAAYKALLARRAGQEDIVVGTVVSGRTRVELEAMLGSFVNMVLLRTDLSGDPDFQMLVGRVLQSATDAFAHQEVPFGKLVEALQPARSRRSSPFCRTVFTLGNVPFADHALALAPDLTLTWAGISNGTVRFDFEMAIDDLPDGLRGRFDYNVDLFRPETAARLCEEYVELLGRFLEHPEVPVSRLLGSLDEGWGEQETSEPAPEPAPESAGLEDEYVAPRTPVEARLAQIWTAALEVDRVGVHDDFFALGGHSLLAAQLVAQLRADFEVDLSLQQFLEACTVAELATAIAQERESSSVDEDTALRLLAQVEQMSDGEVARLLERATGSGQTAPWQPEQD